MEKNLVTEAQRYLNSRHKDKRRSQVLRVAAVLVVFATVYALILPAVTMSNEVECGMVEHIHGEACWQEQLTSPQPQLVCAAQSSGAIVLHTHDSYCYDSQGTLICPLEEREIHVHDSDCYREHRELICTETPDPGHTHTAACYARERGELICGLEETGAGHLHTDGCYLREQREELICGQEETGPGHAHTDDCYPQERTDELICGREEDEDHSHTEECYRLIVIRKELKCTLEEAPDEKDEEGNVIVPGHKHTKECWKTDEELRICGQEETRGHVHTDACWRIEEDETLICGQEEVQGHTHSDQCYEWTPRLTCQEEERPEGHVHTDDCYEITQVFVCLKQEMAPHTHGEGCYDESGALICGLPEAVVHQHTEACFVTPEGEPEPTRTLICGQEEHTHVEQCYVKAAPKEEQTFYCGMNEHIHTMPECYFETGTLRCTLIEHVHDLTCMEPPVEPVASEEPTESLEPSESLDPEASQEPVESLDPEASQDPTESDPAASEDPVSSEEPVRPVIEGVELENAEFPDVYVSDAFSLSFTVSGFAPVAEGQQPPQSSGEAPADPAPAPSGEELVEITNQMVPLAAGPRMLSFTAASVDSAPYSGPDLDSAAAPTINEFDGTTEPGSDPEPGGTAVFNSSHLPLNNQEQAELEPAETQTVPAFDPSNFTIVVPTTPAPEVELEPERVLLDPDQVRFVVEPLETDGDEWEAAVAAAAELGEEEQALVFQLLSVSAYIGDQKLDMSTWDMEAEVTFSEQFLYDAESTGEEQISTIGGEQTDEPAGDVSTADMGTVISVVDLDSIEEVAYAPVKTVQATGKSMRFAMKAPRNGDSKVGLMLIRNVYPHFDVQYYAYVKQPKATGGAATLTFIDTSAKTNGTTSAALPKNGVTPNTKGIALDEKGNVLFDDGVLQQIYLPKTQQFNPLEKELTVDGLMKMSDEKNSGLSHYELKELWVLKDGYTAEQAAKDEDNSDTYWEKYPNWEKLSFTNNPAAVVKDGDNPVLLIQESETKKTVFRMVYGQRERENEIQTATFYDYDITENGVRDDGKVNVLKQGINSNKRGDNVLGFGNGPGLLNTGLGGNKGKDRSYINQATNAANNELEGYNGCSFGLVDKKNGEHDVTFGNGVIGPSLFGTTAEGVKGKRVLGGYSLEFMGEGDTYTMTAVKKGDDNVLSDLHKLGHTKPNWNNTRILYSNEFWPLDGDPGTDPLFGKYRPFTTNPKNENEQLPASDYGEDHNAYFGMHFTIQFTLPKDYTGPLEYYFYGDDDMWVFMNDELVCDIGGVHGSVGEYVNLWDYLGGDEVRYQERPSTITKTLSFFYTERGACGSTCWMQYTLPNATSVNTIIPPGEGPKLTIEKNVAGNMATQADKEAFYTFDLNLTGTTQLVAGKLYNANNELVKVVEPPTELVDGRYSFTATDEKADDQSPDPNNYNIYFEGGKLRFQLKDGWKLVLQDLPPNAKYKVTEVFPDSADGKPPEGCVVTVKRDAEEEKAGYEASDESIKASGSEVKFTNNFNYELPETGGAGTWYTMAGLPLMAAALCLWYKKKSQERGRRTQL